MWRAMAEVSGGRPIGFSHVDVGRAVAKFLHAKGRRRLAVVAGDDERALRGPEQLDRLRRFQRLYNDERPHQALGNATPAEHYAISPRRFDGVLRAPDDFAFDPPETYEIGDDSLADRSGGEDVGSSRVVVVVFARERAFGSFFAQHMKCLCR
mgnify:CR=1 FL=1